MSPTVRTGDYLVVETVCMRARKALSYLCEIKRGDVVVFENPTDRYDVSGKNDLMVKRVAGLAGDRLRIERGKLVINGNVVPETYKPWADMPGQTPSSWPTSKSEARQQEILVPFDSVFVLGDNREHSLDSRVLGAVPRREIVGRVLFTFHW